MSKDGMCVIITGSASGLGAATAGILAKSGEVTLSNVVVQSNAARASAGNSAQGGGIYMINGAVQFNASLTIQNSIIKNNGAFGGAAGAAAAGGASNSSFAITTICTLE